MGNGNLPLRVSNFLWFDLETGAKVAAWWTIILTLLAAIEFLEKITYFLSATTNLNGLDEHFKVRFTLVLIFITVNVVYICLMWYASITLFKGIKNRNRRQIKLFMILVTVASAAFLVLAVFQIFPMISCTLSMIFFYFSICVYSLYMEMKDEQNSENSLKQINSIECSYIKV